MASSNFAIETQNLSKAYKDFTAVRQLNLVVPQGEVFGFLGPNGAGKTTTIMMLLGNVRPTPGRRPCSASLSAMWKRGGASGFCRKNSSSTSS